MGSSFYIPAITIIIFILIPEKCHSSFYLFSSYEISIIIPRIFPEKKSDTVALELLLLPKYFLRIIYISFSSRIFFHVWNQSLFPRHSFQILRMHIILSYAREYSLSKKSSLFLFFFLTFFLFF